MSRKGSKKDKKKQRYEGEHSEGEEMNDGMADMGDGHDKGVAEILDSGENSNQDIMKAILSLKGGLYKKN